MTSFDLSNLVSYDYENSHSSSIKEDDIISLAQEHTQSLFNALFTLPIEVTDVGLIAKLPTPSNLANLDPEMQAALQDGESHYVSVASIPLPRSRSIPKVREPTKWESFAKAKGINKTKNTGKQWNEDRQDWVASHGGRSHRNDEVPSDWIEEIK